MTFRTSIRTMVRAALCAAMAACTTLASAQHGGGPGGGGPGGGGGFGGGAHPAQSGPIGGISGPAGIGAPNGMSGIGGGSMIRSSPTLTIPGRFWNDSSMAHTLNLRPEQQRRMDSIFEANRSSLQSAYLRLQREETTLTSMNPKREPDQTKVFAAIDRVAQARSDLEKQKRELVLALRKELDASQVSQLDSLTTSAH